MYLSLSLHIHIYIYIYIYMLGPRADVQAEAGDARDAHGPDQQGARGPAHGERLRLSAALEAENGVLETLRWLKRQSGSGTHMQ